MAQACLWLPDSEAIFLFSALQRNGVFSADKEAPKSWKETHQTENHFLLLWLHCLKARNNPSSSSVKICSALPSAGDQELYFFSSCSLLIGRQMNVRNKGNKRWGTRWLRSLIIIFNRWQCIKSVNGDILDQLCNKENEKYGELKRKTHHSIPNFMG